MREDVIYHCPELAQPGMNWRGLPSQLPSERWGIAEGGTTGDERGTWLQLPFDSADSTAESLSIVNPVRPRRAKHDIDPGLMSVVVVARREEHRVGVAVTVYEARHSLDRLVALRTGEPTDLAVGVDLQTHAVKTT